MSSGVQLPTRWRGAVAQYAIVIALFVAVCGPPILTAAFDQDETRQIEFLAGMPPRFDSGMTKLGLWTFFEGSGYERRALDQAVFEGREPWCRSAEGPPPKMRFFRPLASATLVADHALFGVEPFGYHLQNLLWFVVLLGILAALLHRLLSEAPVTQWWKPSLASGALFLFAFAATHAETVGRVATRHLLAASVFGMLALLLHVVSRERSLAGGTWVAGGCLLLSFLCSENAVQVVPYLVGYEIWRTAEPPGRRLRALVPVLVLTLGYVVFHALSGYGAQGIDYLDPLRTPAGVLARELPLRFADLTLAELLALPAWLGVRRTPWLLTRLDAPAAGRIALALAVLLAYGYLVVQATRHASPARRGAVRALAAGGLLSLFPALFGQPGTRLLFLPSLGVAVAAAAVIGAGARAHTLPSKSARDRLVLGLGALVLFVLHGLLSPPGLYAQLRLVHTGTHMLYERWRLPASAATAEVAAGQGAGGVTDVVVLAVPSLTVPHSFYPELNLVVGPQRSFRRSEGQRWWFLSNNMLDFGHDWQRVGPRHFELRVGRPKIAVPRSRSLWIGCDAPAGLVVETRLMRIVVLEADRTGAILRLGIELTRDPEDPSLLFASWRDGALRPVPVLALGQSIALD